MTLKEQIEKTIAAYEESCKPENLNYEYCTNNSILHGICRFAYNNEFNDLKHLIKSKVDDYLSPSPYRIIFGYALNYYEDFQIQIKNPTILKAHKVRIKFLKQLLKEVI